MIKLIIFAFRRWLHDINIDWEREKLRKEKKERVIGIQGLKWSEVGKLRD